MKMGSLAVAFLVLLSFLMPVAGASEYFPKIVVELRTADPVNVSEETTFYAVLNVKFMSKDERQRCELDFKIYRYYVELQYLQNGNVGFMAGQIVKGEKLWGYSSLFFGAVPSNYEHQQAFAVVEPSFYELRIYLADFSNLKFLEDRAKENNYKNLNCKVVKIRPASS